MKKVNTNTEVNDYDVYCQGLVISGEVLNFSMSIENVDEDSISTDELNEIEEHCKQELLNKVYSPELNFD